MSTEENTAFEYEDVIETKEDKDEEEQEAKNEEGVDEDPEADEEQEEEEELSPAEAKARSEGWVPEDEWKGDKDAWVNHREFNYRGELMRRIQSQSAQIHQQMEKTESLEEALSVLGEMNEKIAKTEYSRALKDLKAQKREALDDDDYDTADSLDEQIDELKESKDKLSLPKKKEEEKEKAPKNELNAVQKQTIESWYTDPKNSWYEEDEFLRPAADQILVSRLEQNGGDFEDALTYMGTKMRTRFPNETGGAPKRRGAVTETNSRANNKSRNKSKSKFGPKDLSEEQAKVAKTFVDTGVFKSTQEYVDQLVATGDLS